MLGSRVELHCLEFVATKKQNEFLGTRFGRGETLA